MAINFPNSPANNEIYYDSTSGNRYIYNGTEGVWKFYANTVGVSVSSTPPSGVGEGSMWWNRDTGRMFVYYNDGSSLQWVETTPAPGSIDSGLVASYANAAASAVYAVANAAFGVANAAYTSSNADFTVSNAAFARANTALQNTTGNFSGSLGITGSLGVGTTSISSELTVDGVLPKLEMRSGGYLMMRPVGNTWDMRLQANAATLNVFSGGDLTNAIATFVHGGSVGIGTTSPSARLNVRGGRTYLEAASEPYSLYVAHNSATSGVFLGGTSTGGLQISNAGGGAWVNIDSSGRVTMPFMPAFWAYGSGSQSWSGAQTQTKVNFSSGSQYVTSNKSAGWSQANSRFTAPVAGTYEFVLTFALQAGPSTGPAAILYRNGSSVQEVCIGYYSTTYSQCTGNMFIDLNVNDFVEFWISNYNSTSFTLDLNRCHFSGRLIG